MRPVDVPSRVVPTDALVVCALILAMLLGGCAFSSQIKPSEPAGVAQQLTIRSLERALAKLDVGRFGEKKVAVDLHTQYGNEEFVNAFTTAWLEAHGVRVASETPELQLRVFVSVLGTDRNERLIGIPSLQVPVFSFPTPEIAFFKKVRHRGQAEVSLYAFDARTGRFVESIPAGVGLAEQDDYTVLLLISFTVTDVDQRSP